jgi:hypothetical protein
VLNAFGGRTKLLNIGILSVDLLWNRPDSDDDQQSLHLVFPELIQLGFLSFTVVVSRKAHAACSEAD